MQPNKEILPLIVLLVRIKHTIVSNPLLVLPFNKAMHCRYFAFTFLLLFFCGVASDHGTVCVYTSPTKSTARHPLAKNWFHTVTTTVTKSLETSPVTTTLCYLTPVEETPSTPPATGNLPPLTERVWPEFESKRFCSFMLAGNQEPYGEGTRPHWVILATLCILLALFFIVFSFQYFIITIAAVGFVFASKGKETCLCPSFTLIALLLM